MLDGVGLQAANSGGVGARGEKDGRGPALLASQISAESSEPLLLLTDRETGGPFGFLCVTCEAGERGTRDRPLGKVFLGKIFFKKIWGEFLGSPVVKTLLFNVGGW